MNARILVVDAARRRWHLRVVRSEDTTDDPRRDYLLLGGEALCQRLLFEEREALVIARGPLAFLPGNKTTVGYLSPLTGLPHYSFVGGRAHAELLNLGLDAVMLVGVDSPQTGSTYLTIRGSAPSLKVAWVDAGGLPKGQRSSFYHLAEKELGDDPERGSIFTVGEGALFGYPTANLAVDGIYHAGRGGAGHVFARFIRALVLQGDPVDPAGWLVGRTDAVFDVRDLEVRPRLEVYGERLSRRDGGTVTKLYATGSGERPTLPARNAQRVGYALSDLGARKVFSAQRVGQTGCRWCQVNCRHWHWVDVDYAPQGRDRYLDDFEPTYAIYAMLDLLPAGESLRDRLALIDEVEKRIIVPVEQLGVDVIDIGVGMAALFEGLERGWIPLEDVPEKLRNGPYLGRVEKAAEVVEALREGSDAPALQSLGAGPQGLAARYPMLRDTVFTCGAGTLGNPGHANALWTFLMPFSRFFGHYSGQIYKVPGELKPHMNSDELHALFEAVIQSMLRREYFGILGNALSACAFTFVVFSQDGKGEALDDSDLLARTMGAYGITANRMALEWFAEAFWAQSIAFKMECGWQPPDAASFPLRVFEILSQVLDRPVEEVRVLMDMLIEEWKRQAGEVLAKFGYELSMSDL